MDRRTFLSRTLAGGAAALSSPWQMAHAAATHPSLLFVRNVTPRSSASALFSFLDPITSHNVPVCVAIKFDQAEWESADQNTELMEVLQKLIIDYPGLVDLAIEIPGLAGALPLSANARRQHSAQPVRAGNGQSWRDLHAANSDFRPA